jgi:hypothetical protein
VEHLQCCGGEHYALEAVSRGGVVEEVVTGDGLPSPVAEECAKPLALREHRARKIHERSQFWGDGGELRLPARQVRIDIRLNEVY